MKKSRIFQAAGIAVLLLMLAGCARKVQPAAADDKEEVVITAVFREDPETGERSNMELVEQFNESYKGQYRVEVEWMVDTEANYRRKMKTLNALDQLPALITDVGFDYYFYQLLIENDRLVDLSAYIEECPEWKDAIRADIYQEMKEEDGSIYMSPLGNLMYSSAGIIYNKELLKQAGYETFPDNWEEIERCMARLQEEGITPLALHGSGTYWVPMLFSTAYESEKEGGMEFFHERFPDTYQTAQMEEMMRFFKQLYGYTWQDALDIDYAEAENRFYEGKAAIIANGPWMFMVKSLEEKLKYGFVTFPGDKLVGDWRMTSWAVIKNQPEEVVQGAVEFMKFRTLKDKKDVENDIGDFANREEDGVMKMYLEKSINTEKLVPNYQIIWEQEIIDDYMTAHIPDYIKGTISEEELLAGVDDEIHRIDQSR